MKNYIYIGFYIFFFISLTGVAQEPVWLSNQPPKSMKKIIKTSGMHRYSSFKKKRGKSKHSAKKQGKKTSYKPSSTKYVHWIRQGASVDKAPYICLPDSMEYDLVMMSPERKKAPVKYVKDSVCYITFHLDEEGYYNAYLITKQGLGDTLQVNIAKAELLSHSCRNGHHKKLEARPVQFYPEITDFEIIRQRKPHETYHFFISSGDEVKYTALYKGHPLTGAQMSLHTQKGWSKTGLTDKEGNFKVQFIQDYFTDWKELDKRKIYFYLVTADYTIKQDVRYKGKDYQYIHYTTTMSDGYRPSRIMYASMVWALVVFLVTLIISILVIYIYKERRSKPYKEINFNEK